MWGGGVPPFIEAADPAPTILITAKTAKNARLLVLGAECRRAE